MTTSIFFNGRSTSIPGSYSEVDASGLAVVGLSAVGIVALLGEAEGGSPYGGGTPVHEITAPGSVRRTFREGDLVEAANIAFDPAKDPDIPGGAVELRCVKVNPATQSAVTLDDAAAADSLTITSVDYGLFTTQINVDVATGTNKGKAYTVTLGDTVEVFDDVGGDTVWSAQYTAGSNPVSTMTIALDNVTGVTAVWTLANVGLDSEIAGTSPGAEQVSISSSAIGDTTQTATVYGLDASGDPQTEQLALDGTSVVVGTATWQANGVLGIELDGAATGTVTLTSNPTTATTLITLAPAALTAGLILLDDADIALGSTLSVVADSAGTEELAVFGFKGLTAGGEKLVLNGTTPVPGTDVDWTEATVIAVGAVPAATTVTLTATNFALGIVAYDTVKKVADYINNVGGWVATIPGISGSNPGALEIADLDEQAAVTALGATVLFVGDLAFVIDVLNDQCSLVNAAKASGATAPPANTVAPVYLVGGVEGATAFADWQAALDLLRAEFVSTIVPLTTDPAVHAATVAHCVYMGGPGKKERDCVLGGTSGVTKTQAKADAVALNTRHARYVFQDIDRFNTDGAREVFPPPMTAAMVAGAQAGSDVGESLTFKYMNCLDVSQDSTFVLEDDANSLIQSGLWFMEPVKGVGFRCVRNVTTYLIDSNLAYTEASVNEAVNFTAFNVRTNLEVVVGKKGFQRTINQAVSNVINTLAQLIDAEVIVNWRNLTITLDSDVMTVDVEVAPVIPVNFVKTTLHLVSASFAAAA